RPGARARISSIVRMPAMPLPIRTSRGFRGISIFMIRSPLGTGWSDARGAERRRTPGRPPARLDAGQGQERQAREAGEHEEAGLVAGGELLGIAEAGGEIETAEAAGHADDAGHDADLAAEALGHELKHGAVTHAERQHAKDEHAERDPGGRQAEARDGERD